MLESIDAVISGETTLAELEGLTAAEAYAIADFGWTMLGQGRIEAAAAIFESLTISNPRHAYFHALYGSALQKLGDVEAALEAYQRVLRMDPNDSVGIGATFTIRERYLPAIRATERGDPDRAIRLLTEVQARRPGDPFVPGLLATIYELSLIPISEPTRPY